MPSGGVRSHFQPLDFLLGLVGGLLVAMVAKPRRDAGLLPLARHHL